MDEDTKSAHGNSFKAALYEKIRSLRDGGKILEVETRKKVGQFYCPYLIKIHDGHLAIFTTTTARSDRIKSQQWDAWGIKNGLDVYNLKCILVLPDDISEKEIASYEREKAKIKQEGYTTFIDKIIQLSEFETII